MPQGRLRGSQTTPLPSHNMNITPFTGGIFDTNCFLIARAGKNTLIDAPQGCAEWLAARGEKIDTLLLTHGHIDHVVDAARLQREHGCSVGYHEDGRQMLTEPGFFRKLGFEWEVEPVQPDFLIEEREAGVFNELVFQTFLVPGHCPGSICFYDKEAAVLFGGDVLFAGGVGRWDLPGGDRDLLLSGIKNKILPLPDAVTVFPGHGPPTRIGEERRTNPFLA